MLESATVPHFGALQWAPALFRSFLVERAGTLRSPKFPQFSEPAVPVSYIPILVLILLATVFAVIALAVPAVLGPHRPTKARLEPYESGMLPYSDARRRFPVQYYVIAVLFILFDIEVIFLYPWAVMLRQLKLFGLIEMAVFLAILLIGYLYIWRKCALDW